MATKTWKIEKDLCRCCHAEGTFDNLAEPRIFLEKEEIYSDMLRECLDIDIPPVPGELCAITYTICSTCITRLRDACNFKKQVQDCEQRFMTLYYKNAIQGIKPETIVKEEFDVTIEDGNSEGDIECIVKKEDDDDDDDDDDDVGITGAGDDDDDSDDYCIKRTRSSTKATPKATPKAKPKAKPKAPVKKEKPSPQAKKKPEPKAVKEKKGEYTDFTLIQADGKEQYKCNTCEKCFHKRSLFAQHYAHVHLKMRPKVHACYLCNEKIPSYQRSYHMEEKHGMPAPSCGACGKKFPYPWQVLRHQKFYHMGESDYRCDICDLKFKSGSGLKKHNYKHLGKKSFKCQLCDKTFTYRRGLKVHLLIHNNVRRHVCHICQDSFVQKSSLSYHLMKKHPEAV